MKSTTAITVLILALAIGLTTGCTRDPADASAASTPKARFATVVIPDGTSVTATLDAAISPSNSHSGDTFAITTVEPIMVGATTADVGPTARLAQPMNGMARSETSLVVSDARTARDRGPDRENPSQLSERFSISTPRAGR